MCGLTPAGLEPMPTPFADTLRNWSRWRRRSFWPMATQPWEPLDGAAVDHCLVQLRRAHHPAAGNRERAVVRASIGHDRRRRTGFASVDTCPLRKLIRLANSLRI